MKLALLLLLVGLAASAPTTPGPLPVPSTSSPLTNNPVGYNMGTHVGTNYVYPGSQFTGGQPLVSGSLVGQPLTGGYQQPFLGNQPFVGGVGSQGLGVPGVGQPIVGNPMSPVGNSQLVGHAAPVATGTPVVDPIVNTNLPLNQNLPNYQNLPLINNQQLPLVNGVYPTLFINGSYGYPILPPWLYPGGMSQSFPSGMIPPWLLPSSVIPPLSGNIPWWLLQYQQQQLPWWFYGGGLGQNLPSGMNYGNNMMGMGGLPMSNFGGNIGSSMPNFGGHFGGQFPPFFSNHHFSHMLNNLMPNPMSMAGLVGRTGPPTTPLPYNNQQTYTGGNRHPYQTPLTPGTRTPYYGGMRHTSPLGFSIGLGPQIGFPGIGIGFGGVGIGGYPMGYPPYGGYPGYPIGYPYPPLAGGVAIDPIGVSIGGTNVDVGPNRGNLAQAA